MAKFGDKTVALAKRRAAEDKFLDIGVYPEAGGWWIYDTSSEHLANVPIEWASDRGVVDDAVKRARRAWERALGKPNRVEVRDSSGVRARSRSLVAAHRTTRRANMAGTKVGRVLRQQMAADARENVDSVRYRLDARAADEVARAAVATKFPAITVENVKEAMAYQENVIKDELVKRGWVRL